GRQQPKSNATISLRANPHLSVTRETLAATMISNLFSRLLVVASLRTKNEKQIRSGSPEVFS
ncbi:hypothetical protein KA068_01200, partial [Candidatus Saccharibacteria bacterium]|nr:hypothetical protein [Candidatus Saccharibacteria bacterium]